MPAFKLRAILFDIGNVLVRVDVACATAGLAADTRLSPQEIWTALQHDPRWRDWQEGRLSPREWHSHVTLRLGGKLHFEEFCAVWNRALSPEPLLADDLLAELSRRRYRLCVLSNTDPIHVAHMESNFPFLRHFPHRVYSCATRVSKPNPAIYKAGLAKCGVAAKEALYIDDIPAYVEAAQGLGMDGIVFSSAEQLQIALQARGIVPTIP